MFLSMFSKVNIFTLSYDKDKCTMYMYTNEIWETQIAYFIIWIALLLSYDEV